jgi:Beta-lactamase enzyme family
MRARAVACAGAALASTAVAAMVLAATTLTPAGAAPASATSRAASAGATCVAPQGHKQLAGTLQKAITAVLRSRLTSSDPSYDPFEDVSLAVSDPSTGLRCWYHSTRHNYSGSAVKAIILAALLLKAQDEHRHLTAWEKSEAWLMITQSDNDAATALWNDVGLASLQHFLNVAKMRQTVLDNYAWGLTLLTAHDETLLLHLLMSPGKVLTNKSRAYELYLMNHVTPSQAWGVRAGSPKYYTWHIKNGWAPLPNLATSLWVVNSIGCFLHKAAGYTIVVLTHDNPEPGDGYGIATIQDIAWVVNRNLVPGARSVWPK